MDENKTNNSQEQENKKNKKGIKAWWLNLGKGVRTTICVLGGVAVVTAITVPTVIAAKGCAGDKSKTKTTEITGTGSDLIKAVTLTKQSDGSYKGSIEVAAGKSIDDIGSIIIKVGNKVLVKNTDYTLNSSNGELIIKANVISANDNITIEVVKFTGEVTETIWNEAFTSISDSNTRNYSGTKVKDGNTTNLAVNKTDDSLTISGTTKYETIKNDLRYNITDNGSAVEIDSVKVKTEKSNFDEEIVDPVKGCMNGKYNDYSFDESTKSYKGSFSNDTNVEIKFGSNKKVNTISSTVASSTTAFSFKDYGTTTVNVPLPENEFNTVYQNRNFESPMFSYMGTHEYYYFNLDLKNKPFLANKMAYTSIFNNDVGGGTIFNVIDDLKVYVDGQELTPSATHSSKDYYCFDTNDLFNHNNAVIVLKLKAGTTFQKPQNTYFSLALDHYNVFLDSNNSATAYFDSDFDCHEIYFPITSDTKNAKITFDYTSGDGIKYIYIYAMHNESFSFESNTVSIYSIDSTSQETLLVKGTDYSIYQNTSISLNNYYKNKLRVEFTASNKDLFCVFGSNY